MYDTYEEENIYIYILAAFLFLIYRIYILTNYTAQYIDDDQALMWYGTAEFAHFHFHEPCYFGQAYGSMLESAIAVPLYWMRVPLNIAVPSATVALALIPFAYLSIKALKQKKYVCAFMTLLVATSMSWEWDVITTVPRSFVPGFLFSIIGTTWIQDNGKLWKNFIGSLLAMIGILITNTAISLLGIGLLARILYCKRKQDNMKDLFPIGTGIAAGAALGWLIKLFYQENPDYSLHPSPTFQISVETFRTNLSNLDRIMGWFTAYSNGILVIIAVFFAASILLWKHRLKAYILQLCMVCGTLLMLSANALNNYVEGSLLYGQLRMLVFIPYLTALTIYLIGYYEENVTDKVNLSARKQRTLCCIAALCLVSVGIKVNFFNGALSTSESELYNPAIIRCEKVSNIYKYAEKVNKLAQNNACDVVIQISDIRCFGYASSAINYGNYIPYNAFYDRRTWIYHQLQEANNYRCLLVNYEGENGISTEIVEITNVSVVDWLEQNYAVRRRPI